MKNFKLALALIVAFTSQQPLMASDNSASTNNKNSNFSDA